MTSLRILSLGAGVQSTTLALMTADGTLPRVDAAIFADTGWEPRQVYDHLDKLERELSAAGIPLYRVARGNLREDTLNPEVHAGSMPFFILNADGSDGMVRRQCTARYKLAPIGRKVRELLGASAPDFKRVPKGHTAEQWIGFSTDEIGRVSNAGAVAYTTRRYPLLELEMSRDDCDAWLRERGWTEVIKSACIGCPFHGNEMWRKLRDMCVCGHHRDNHWGTRIPAGELAPGTPHACAETDDCPCVDFSNPEWDDAVQFDEAIRTEGQGSRILQAQPFLHRSLQPLAIADLSKKSRKELLAEKGDPDGCSPYSCRSGEAVQEEPDDEPREAIMTTKPKTDAPEVEPEALSSPLVETALGGATLDELRETSVIVPEITRSIEFHGTPVAAQVLREVLGEIERACAEASRRKPNNRKGELRHVELSTLRQLAALCRVWKPDVGMLTSPREVALQDGVNALVEQQHEVARAQALPETIVPVSAQPVSPATTPEASAERAAAVALIEEQLGAERIDTPNGRHELPAVHLADPEDDAALASIPGMTDELGWTIPRVHAADDPDVEIPQRVAQGK